MAKKNKKLVGEIRVDNLYLHIGWTDDKSEMVVTMHVPVKSHFEFVESSSS